MKKILAIVVLLACTRTAHADEASKRAKIGKLLVAQGMEQMIQEQLDQSAASVSSMGSKMFAEMAPDATVIPPAVLKKLEAVNARFLKDASSMFTAKEMVDTWSETYGKDLSERELDKILAYYTSPIGQKDIASSKLALTAFGQKFSVESEKRVMLLLKQFNKDLEAAAKP